jgi:hypothetical protein
MELSASAAILSVLIGSLSALERIAAERSTKERSGNLVIMVGWSGADARHGVAGLGPRVG